MIQERPYQEQLINDIQSAWASGHRNVLAVLPTGGGKSVCVSKIALNAHLSGMNQCIIAHRTELVSQMSCHVARRGIPHRIIGPKKVVKQVTNEHRREFGRSWITPDGNCAVGGVDTLLARSDSLKDWMRQIDQWTIDEGHHVLKHNKWGKVAEMFVNARGLGVTATPKRADGQGLGAHHDGVFDAMVLGPTMRWLIDNGYLTDYQIAVPESDFKIDDSAVTATGDYSRQKMKQASQRSHIVGDVVVEYLKRSKGKRAIVFATDVETSGDIARQFKEAGVEAESVSAKTPSDVRSEYIRRFRDGRITVLVNVDLFGEGFDVPAVETVIMARPTASLGVFLQQFGRVLRILEGKKHGLVIDHVSNWKRHGLPDKNHAWSLDRREKGRKKEKDPEDIPLTACRSCSRPYERFHQSCPYCGHVPVAAGVGRGDIEKIDGDLMLLDMETLAQMRAETNLEAPDAMGRRVTAVAGDFAGLGAANRQIERIQQQQALASVIDQWAGIQRHMGRADSESHRRFYLTTGMTTLDALTMSRREMEKLTVKIRSWYE